MTRNVLEEQQLAQPVLYKAVGQQFHCMAQMAQISYILAPSLSHLLVQVDTENLQNYSIHIHFYTIHDEFLIVLTFSYCQS